MQLETLARKVAKRETETKTVDQATVDRMMGILHHTHVPMMADMGIVASDPDTDHIEFAENWSY